MMFRVRLAPLRCRTPLSSVAQNRCAFTTTQRRLLKEDADRSPEHIEQKKQESVDKAKRGDGEWHEELASSGESNVKADKHDVEDHDQHMEDLQKETAKKGEKGEI